jgi:hypothetical protein
VRLRAGALALVTTAVSLAGCGPIAFVHDKLLSPISPAGQLHPVVMGRGFRVGKRGIETDLTRTGRLRPIPPQSLQRLRNFQSLVQGIEFAVMSLSYVVDRRVDTGRPLPAEVVSELPEGIDQQQVLSLLGVPDAWVRRATGSVMAYAAERSRDLVLALGVPPGVSDLIPIPGVAQSKLVLTWSTETPYKTILFFDPEGRLELVVQSGGYLVDEDQGE